MTAASEGPAPAAPSRNAFRRPDFVKLWTAATISLFGTQVTFGGGFGAGALLGAFTASRVAERVGVGRAIVGSAVLAAPATLLVPLASRETALLLMGGGGLLSGWANVVYNVNQVSLRQSITPEPMLGRMNATMRFIVWGTIPIGQMIGGAIATLFGTITSIWIGAIGGLFVFLPVLLSPVRSLRRIEDAKPES